MTLAEAISEIRSGEPDVMAVFHSRVEDTTAGLRVMLEKWSGPMLTYPDAGRTDYTQTWRDLTVANEESPEEFASTARRWVEMGAQVKGSYCGFGADYAESLRGAMPDRIAEPRNA